MHTPFPPAGGPADAVRTLLGDLPGVFVNPSDTPELLTWLAYLSVPLLLWSYGRGQPRSVRRVFGLLALCVGVCGVTHALSTASIAAPVRLAAPAAIWGVGLVLLRLLPRAVSAVEQEARAGELERLRLLEAAVTASGDGLMVAEAAADGRPGTEIVFTNPAFEQMTGYAADETVGQSPSVFCAADAGADALDLVRAALRGSEPVRTEIASLRKDGTRVWAEWHIVPVADGTGAITHWVAILRDTTDHREAREEVRRTHDFLKSLVDNIPVLVTVADADDRYRLVNPAWERAAGVTPGTAVGRTPGDVLPPAAAADLRRQNTAARATGRPVREEVSVDSGGGRRDYMSVTFPLAGPDGRAGAVGRVSVDVTEKKRAEELVRRSEERYRPLFDSNPHPMWVTDPATIRFLAVNDAAVALYGYTREEFLRMGPCDLDPPEETGTVVGDTLPPGANGGRRQHRTKDGRAVDVEVSCGRLRYDGADALLVLVLDVTERRRLESHLRQAQKMEAVGRLAGGVAHDFNNLLTVIRGNVDLLRDQGPGPDEAARLIDEVSGAAERATGLVRQLLTFSRRQPARPEVVDLNGVVSDLAGMLRRLLGAQVSIETDLALAPVTVRADRGQLEQVVMNLAVNARDAMPHGGRLRIAVRRSESAAGTGQWFAQLAVTDTGHGMTAEVKAKIFEPFFTTKGPDKGTGLGLATVYGIVTQAGGQIRVESSPGAGTTFHIDLPWCSDPAPRLSTVRPGRLDRTRPTGGGRTVLLVEDEDGVRGLGRSILKTSGFTVTDVPDGESALALLAQGQSFDLLVTDLTMPGIDGRELAERVRAVYPGIAVVFTSGYAADVDRLVDLPGSLFLPKPFTPVDFLWTVNKALRVPQGAPLARVR
ncbi:MAG: Blue-light-activated protein [Gemmataceae bacterium]|nr:Blue-light-activated protein [Gemmataceae bacterium]